MSGTLIANGRIPNGGGPKICKAPIVPGFPSVLEPSGLIGDVIPSFYPLPCQSGHQTSKRTPVFRWTLGYTGPEATYLDDRTTCALSNLSVLGVY